MQCGNSTPQRIFEVAYSKCMIVKIARRQHVLPRGNTASVDIFRKDVTTLPLITGKKSIGP